MKTVARFASRADGGKIEILQWTNPAATTASRLRYPILMVHGFTQTAHSFVDAAQLMLSVPASSGLAPPSTVYSMSVRGHGKSTWKGPYTRDAMAKDIELVANELELKKFHLCGMSLGSSLSVEAVSAVLDHRRVASLALIDWAPVDSGDVPPGVEKILMLSHRLWDTFEGAVDEMAAFNPRRSKENIRDRLTHQLAPTEEGKWRWATDPNLIQGLAATRAKMTQWDDLKSITCPCLCIRGEVSEVLSKARAERLAAALPKGRLVTVPKAGHSVAGDNPEGFIKVFLPFVREAEASEEEAAKASKM